MIGSRSKGDLRLSRRAGQGANNAACKDAEAIKLHDDDPLQRERTGGEVPSETTVAEGSGAWTALNLMKTNGGSSPCTQPPSINIGHRTVVIQGVERLEIASLRCLRL